MRNRSFKLALTGVFSALALVFMMSTGLFPFATYALPAISGIMFIPVMVELGGKTAFSCFAATAVLAILFVPDKEAAMMFVALLGHYPITKGIFERVKSRVVEYILKFALFNAVVLLIYTVIAELFGVAALLEGMDDLGRYTGVILLVMGNLVFFLYDLGLNRIIRIYCWVIKPKIIDKIMGRRR